MKRLIHDCYVLLKQIERFGEWERKKGRTACRVAALSIDGRITRRIRVRRPLTADITVRVDSLLGPQMTSSTTLGRRLGTRLGTRLWLLVPPGLKVPLRARLARRVVAAKASVSEKATSDAWC